MGTIRRSLYTSFYVNFLTPFLQLVRGYWDLLVPALLLGFVLANLFGMQLGYFLVDISTRVGCLGLTMGRLFFVAFLFINVFGYLLWFLITNLSWYLLTNFSLNRVMNIFTYLLRDRTTNIKIFRRTNLLFLYWQLPLHLVANLTRIFCALFSGHLHLIVDVPALHGGQVVAPVHVHRGAVITLESQQ